MADVTFKNHENKKDAVLPENKNVAPSTDSHTQDAKDEFPLNQPNPLDKPIVKP